MKQKYSLIAKRYLEKLDKEEPYFKHITITLGDFNMMETLVDDFGFDRNADILKNGFGGTHARGFKYVLDKLDRESKLPNAIFRKGYICYNGIINRPTRCFTLYQGEEK